MKAFHLSAAPKPRYNLAICLGKGRQLCVSGRLTFFVATGFNLMAVHLVEISVIGFLYRARTVR